MATQQVQRRDVSAGFYPNLRMEAILTFQFHTSLRGSNPMPCAIGGRLPNDTGTCLVLGTQLASRWERVFAICVPLPDLPIPAMDEHLRFLILRYLGCPLNGLRLCWVTGSRFLSASPLHLPSPPPDVASRVDYDRPFPSPLRLLD